MTRTLSYARVSSVMQVDGYSLQAQRERAADYARFRNWEPPMHFADEGVSGRRDTRPGLSALLAAVRPGDVVIVKDLTRIGRGGAVQTLGIIRQIEQAGASVALIDQNIDTSTPTGKMMLTIMAAFSELEIEQTRERGMIGKAVAAQQGHWPTSSVPYGYRREQRRLVLDPATAPHALRALEALAGRSLREAAELLNAEGVPASTVRTGRGKWTFSQMHEMAQNTAYIGEARWRDLTIPCPPLASPELWRAIHDRATSEGGTPKPALYPLTGHLRCPHGAPFAGGLQAGRAKGGSDYRYYHLPHQARKRYGCHCLQAAADPLEAQARALLAGALSNPSDPAAAHLIHDPAAHTADPHAAEREEVRRQLSALVDLQVRGLLDLEDYMRLRATLKAKERELEPRQAERAAAPLPLLDAAEAIRSCRTTELAGFMDELGVQLVLHPGKRLELVRLSALWAQT